MKSGSVTDMAKVLDGRGMQWRCWRCKRFVRVRTVDVKGRPVRAQCPAGHTEEVFIYSDRNRRRFDPRSVHEGN